jgi:vanillate O-demethylase ferredoxin subunit
MVGTLLTVRVERRISEALDIDSFHLVSADGSRLPAFGPGAHIDVHLPGGLIRQYSLCNSPSETDRYVIAVLRNAEGRGGSLAMHELARVGQTLGISAPRNHFSLSTHAPHHLLLAGGIGVTPIFSMAQKLVSERQSFSLHYCARSRNRAAFSKNLSVFADVSPVFFHFDDDQSDKAFDVESTLREAPAGTHLYVCGPPGYMDLVLGEARRQGWAEDRLHFEFFGTQVQTSASGREFQVRIASTGTLIKIPNNCTVVQALAAHGIEIVTSCEQGVCGTCETRVLEGEPDHRDLYFTPEEHRMNDRFLPCCSRAKTSVLVLDL